MIVWTEEKIPTHYCEASGDVMSNYDHKIDEQVAEELRAGDYYAAYPAREFYGNVWFDGLYKCAIMRYLAYVGTIEAETLQEIMDAASERFGAG